MRITELAMKGVRDLSSPLSRLSFGPGLNVFWTPDAAQRRRVIDILFHTLHPSSDRFDATTEHADSNAAESRAALSYACRSGEVFRLSRDLRSGAGGLYRGDDAGQFSLVTREPIEIVRTMRMYDSVPEAVAYERCLMLNVDSMPALGASAVRRSGAPWNDAGSAAPVAPGMSGFVSSSGADVSLYKSDPRPFAPLEKIEASMSSGPTAPARERPSTPSLKMVMGERAPATLSTSRRSGPPVEPTSGVLAPSMGSAPPQAPSEQWYAETTQEKIAVYKRLSVALETVQRANEAGRELDGLLARRAEITPKLEVVTGQQSVIEQLERAIAGDADLEQLPSDAEARIRGFEEAEERYQASSRRLLGEQDNAEADYHQTSVTPLRSDPYFVGGAVVMVAAFVLALAVDVPYIALANLLGALVAGGAAWRFVNELEMKARLRARLEAVRAAVERLEKNYALETSVTKKIIEQFPLGTEEILGRLQEARERQSELQEAQGRLEEALKGLEETGGLDEAHRLDARIEELEGICAMGATSPAAGMQYESSKLRHQQLAQELASRGLLGSGPTAPARSDPADDEPGYGSGNGTGPGAGGAPGLGLSENGWWASDLSGGRGSGPPSGSVASYELGAEPSPGDRSCAVVQSAADELFLSREEFTGQIRLRLESYVVAFTNGAYQHVLFGPDGRIAVSPGRDVQATPYGLLKGEVLDLVDAALRLAVAEAMSQEIQVPILIDDPFVHLDVARRHAFVQALGFLSELTQVVVATPASDITGHAITLAS